MVPQDNLRAGETQRKIDGLGTSRVPQSMVPVAAGGYRGLEQGGRPCGLDTFWGILHLRAKTPLRSVIPGNIVKILSDFGRLPFHIFWGKWKVSGCAHCSVRG